MIKKLLVISIIIISHLDLVAKCGSFINISARSETLESNTVITVELSSYAISFVRTSILGNSKFYLIGENDKIKLDVVDHFRSHRGKELVVLKSSKQLIIDTNYRLSMISSSKEFSKYFGFRYKSTDDLKRFRIIENTNEPIPNIQLNPKLIELTYNRMGCGPEKYAIFENPVLFDTDAYILMELVNSKTFQIQTYLLLSEHSKLQEGNIYVGHGMCGGAFGYDENGSYKIRFKALNLNWETNEIWSNWVGFESPLYSD